MTLSMGEPPAPRLTVLYDADCGMCRAARRWLDRQAQLVPLEFVPAGSDLARRRFPGLDHAATLVDVTVVAESGEVYGGDSAWLMCLWALSEYRSLAMRLAQPGTRPIARRVVAAASGIRGATADNHYGQGCDDACALPEA
jgi:predicted DCC family thiol-disulfide oxidoreductase YuxK